MDARVDEWMGSGHHVIRVLSAGRYLHHSELIADTLALAAAEGDVSKVGIDLIRIQ